MRKGILFVLTAPSGAGKTTLLDKGLKSVPLLEYSVSVTTRSPRKGEENGKAYWFTTRAEFEALLSKGEFLEHAVVYDNYYGTRRSVIEESLSRGKDMILDIDARGAVQVMEKKYPAVFVYIMPPSMKELERRLRGRATDSEEIIQKRLSLAREEMTYADRYDYVVVNDDLQTAFEEIRAIILAERLKVERNRERIEKIRESR
ncbi:MAG: guanylate kinase [Candidatus Aureabacteria bacterium]|nr:guanylate kinase [Candidatus Auribacterota bacterium]